MRRLLAALAAVLMGVTGVVALTTAPASAAPRIDLKISELRLRGLQGATDEFIEITNAGPTHVVDSLGGSTGYAIATSDGVVRCVIPNGTVIPGGGHFLCAQQTHFSLWQYPAGSGTTTVRDAGYLDDIPDNTGVALFRGSDPAGFSEETRLDAVGFTTSPSLYREGEGLEPFDEANNQHSFLRILTTSGPTGTEVTNPTPGLPQDTDDNVADLVVIEATGTMTSAGQRLGAPGAQSSQSPVAHGGLEVGLLDPCAPAGGAPNAVHAPSRFIADGEVTFRRVVTNTTDQPITRLRFRIADMTTFPAADGHADLRAQTAPPSEIHITDDGCGPGNGWLLVSGTTLEIPPLQFAGAGINSSLSVDEVTPSQPLEPGASLTVQLQAGVYGVGIAGATIIPEITTEAAWVPPVPTCLGISLLGALDPCAGPAPEITEHPEDETVAVGETATFTAAATGYDSVRWETITDGVHWDAIPGEDDTTLSFTATADLDGRPYRAVFRNADGAETPTEHATLTIDRVATELELEVEPDAPVRGDDVELRAEVAPADATGTVQFAVDGDDVGEPVAVVDGVAETTVEDLPTGARSATATYSGDDLHAGSHDTATFDVAPRASELQLFVDEDEVVHGQTVVATALIEPDATVTGTVQFTVDGSQVVDPVAVVDGEAEVDLTGLNVGTRTIKAVYSGDADHTSSEDDTTVEVAKRPTSLDLTADPEHPVPGEPVTFTAAMDSQTATGTVQFAVDGEPVGGPVPVTLGLAVSEPVSDLPVGARTVTAVYSGSKTHAVSDDEITVTVGKVATTIEITAVRPEQPVEGDTVELDVTVTPSSAHGTVQLTLDGDAVGPAVPLVQGSATLQLADVPPGALDLGVAYSGDGSHEVSEDATTVDVVTGNADFVRRAFLTVLGRPADAGGLEYWTGVLDAGGSRERLTDTLARSTEGRRKLVVDAYAAVLNRAADVAGRDYWVGRLAAGLTPEDLVVQFAASPEAKAGAGGTTVGLVGMLYKAHLGRSGDQAGVQYWAGRIDAATTENARRAVAKSFGRTSEVTGAAVRFATQAACAPGTEVPTDAAYASSFASTGRDHLRLAGLVLARHCPQPVPGR